LGAAAHSYWNGARFANVAQVPDYLTAIADRKSPVAFCEQIGHTTEIAETLMLRLRLAEGIAFEDFSRRFGSRLEDDFSSTIVELVDLGLLARTEGRITLTSRGRLLGNEVFRRFLPVQGGNA
jgi:oxygen-independent coproporphyrinogen-3 oxidase